MDNLNALRETLPDAARDIKINLQTIFQGTTLTKQQTWGSALASAYASRNKALTAAMLADANAAGIEEGTLDDAKAAAVLMGMNNVFYRFRHSIGKESYSTKPARLRMMRTTAVTSNKPDFDLFCLAVSAINFCEICMKAHEKDALTGGLTEDHVQDAVRIAAVVHAAAVALETSL